MLVDCKWLRVQTILALLMISFCTVSKNAEGARERGARCEKPDYIPNGSYRIRRDRVMRITCNSGFVLQGSKTIECIRGKWDGEKPLCAKKGCKKDLSQPENGRIQIENELKAILYCADNYNLAGNRHSYCNGSHWDRPIGHCRERKNIVQHECDFETDDICGWTYEPRESLEWKRVMAANEFSSFKTGPRHDHTTLTANGGHFMLMESLTRQNDDVTLTSPIYDRSISLKTACCFQFYYFMYGAGVGDLFVVVKPVSLDIDDLLKNHKDLIKFKKYGNQNNIWNEAHFNIEEFHEDFQIVFVAKSGRGQLSDIAVDDVKLLTGEDCRALNNKDDDEISNEEYDSTTYESIFEMQSCAGHCFESQGSGIIRKLGHLKGLCNCDLDCEDNETCCPDFRPICLNELFSQSTPITETDQAATNNVRHKTLATTTSATKTPKIMSSTTMITTTISTVKPTTRTTKTTPKLTTIAATSTTLATPKSLTAKTTKTTTARASSRTTATRITTPTTTTSKTTLTTHRNTVPTAIATTVTKTTPTTTTGKTTPPTTTIIRTIATKTTPQATTTIKPTTTSNPKPNYTTTPLTTKTFSISTSATKGSLDHTITRRPIPSSKPIEYVITDKTKIEPSNKGHFTLLLYTLFIIIAFILGCAVYKRFGDKAAAWYMIRFKKKANGADDDTSSICTSFKQTHPTSSGSNGNSKATWRYKIKKTTPPKNSMKTPLIYGDNEDDGDDDDSICVNGSIVLKNNIYTEL